MKTTVIPIVVGALGTIPKESRRFGNQRRNGNHPDYSIIKIALNAETPVKDYQLRDKSQRVIIIKLLEEIQFLS